MDFYQNEDRDGVRLPWNILPLNRTWAEKVVLPVGVHYSPLKNIQDIGFLGNHPIMCQSCKGVLNPFCSIEVSSKSFKCSICGARSGLPQAVMKQIIDTGSIPETSSENTTIEYLLDETNRDRAYLFLIDKCVPEEELEEIKKSVLAAVQSLSDDCSVGLVTFDRNVFIQDLEESEYLSELSLNGSKEYDYDRIAKMLNFIIPTPQIVNHVPSPRHSVVLRPLEKCRETFERAVEKIRVNKWPSQTTERPLRAFGSALKVSLSIAAGWYQHGTQIVACLGGNCTYGPGLIIPPTKEIIMRSHDDLVEDSEKIATFKKAKDFYDGLLPTFKKSNSSIVLFAFSCDQYGFAEMRDMITKTGGFIASQELFLSNVFRDSFKNFFQLNEYEFVDKGFGGRMEVTLTKGFKIQGIVGACLSEGNKDAQVSEIVCGEGGTNKWYLGAFDKTSTYSLVLENEKNDELDMKDKPYVIQFRTSYKNGYGQMKMRVTTIQRKIGGISLQEYAQGFDQEAAILMTAKCALSLTGMMDQKEITKWIDKRLIKLYSRFGEYNKGVPSSFKINEGFQMVPQFFYYFRKSTFILNFAISVDEMHTNRTILMRENVSNALVMIQPSILEYNCDSENPVPVVCDISCLKDDVVILFDTYFNVVIWYFCVID